MLTFHIIDTQALIKDDYLVIFFLFMLYYQLLTMQNNREIVKKGLRAFEVFIAILLFYAHPHGVIFVSKAHGRNFLEVEQHFFQ